MSELRVRHAPAARPAQAPAQSSPPAKPKAKAEPTGWPAKDGMDDAKSNAQERAKVLGGMFDKAGTLIGEMAKPVPHLVDTAEVNRHANITSGPFDFALHLRPEGHPDHYPPLAEGDKDVYFAKMARKHPEWVMNGAEVPGMDGTTYLPRSAAEQKAMAAYVNRAYQQGLLNDEDLMRIADAQPSDGTRKLAAQLASDPDHGRSGALEAVGVAAQRRAENPFNRFFGGAESDADAAAIAFSSSRELEQKYLDTPGKRLDAFTRLTRQLEPGQNSDPGARAVLQQNAGQLFVHNGKELTAELTESNLTGYPARALPNFFAEVLYGEGSEGLSAGDGRELRAAIGETLGEVVAGYREQARRVPSDGVDPERAETERHEPAHRIGRIHGALGAAGELMVSRYSDSKEERESRRQQVAGLLSFTLGKLVPAMPGAVTGKVAEGVAKRLVPEPIRPDVSFVEQMSVRGEQEMKEYEKELGKPGIRDGYSHGYDEARRLVADQLQLSEVR